MSSSANNNEKTLGGNTMATINENNGGNTMSMTTVNNGGNNMENYIRKDNGIIVASASSIFPQRDFWLHATEQYAIFLLEENYDCYAVEFFKQVDDIRIRTLEYSEFDCEFSILDTFIVSKTNWETLTDSYGGSEELIYDLLDFLEDSKEKTYNKLKEAYEIDKLIETVISLSEFRDLKIWQVFNHWDELDDFFRKDD